MGKNKDYKTISSRDIQRNFSVLRDALSEDGTVYVSYYNKPFAKVVLLDDRDKKKDNKSDIDDFINKFGGMFAERREEIGDKSYDEVYYEELLKKYG